MSRVELLAPAGNLERMKLAFLYGADAVYAGGEEFSLRSAAVNFSDYDLKEGVEFAHNLGKKFYLTANIIPHNADLNDFPRFIKYAEDIGVDGVIISDLGLFSLTKQYAPSLDIHISTQANNVNYQSANMWHSLGAKRIVVARELSLAEITEINQKTPDDLEIEAFVHGAMCISYSGRCLLSNYMTNRDSNKGECSHPCRWNYYLMEEKRQGEYMQVFENERGTFIYNSKDLCMIEHIPRLIDAGIKSFKIEGRVKSEYYVAAITRAYRRAIDAYYEGREIGEDIIRDVFKVSHREYTTGFYFGKPDDAQVYGSSSYIRDYDVVGIVEGYDKEEKTLWIKQKNKFSVGDSLELMPPVGESFVVTVEKMENAQGEQIQSAPHAEMMVKMPIDRQVEKNTMIIKESVK